MKNRLFCIVLFLQLFVAATANASGFLTTTNPNTGVDIVTFFTHRDGGTTLIISGAISNPDNCQITSRVHLKGDLPGYDNMVAAALTAFASGKKVGLWSSGCDVIPFWGMGIQTPIIENLWVFR